MRNIWRLEWVRDTKFGTDVFNKIILNAPKCEGYSFYCFWFIKGKLPPPSQIRVKNLSNFWKTPDIPLINCEINLVLTWSEKCVITNKAATDADPDADPAVATANTQISATFKIKNTKLYVPLVNLSTENDNKLLEQLKTGFKRTIRWNKYKSEMPNQTKTNSLNNLIDLTFSRVNRLFVLSFENAGDRTSFSKYYTQKVVLMF